jgi:hypothetical protein
MQLLIASTPGMRARKYHDLWSHMLIHFHEQYPLPLRLVAIALILPADTSECERIFSLMNDIKTPERSSMKTETLKHLMGTSCKFKPVEAAPYPDCEVFPIQFGIAWRAWSRRMAIWASTSPAVTSR